MVFGLGKKKKRSDTSASETMPRTTARTSSRAVVDPNGDEGDSSGDTAPAPKKEYKYGGDISRTTYDLAGLPVNVFGVDELTPAPARASAPSPPGVCVVIHMHGRLGKAADDEGIARQMYDRISREKETYRTQQDSTGQEAGETKDVLIVTFDARNHGYRLTNPAGQKDWKSGNPRHAMDLYGMIVGDARDVSFIVDFLAPYLFPYDERRVDQWVVTGKSLGGHATWHVLANEPRITVGVPFIGMPDYTRLLNSRTRTQFVANGPPYVPASLKALIDKIDPAKQPYDIFDSVKNPFWGKKICVLSGARDKLVLWDWNQDFLNALVLAEPQGPTATMPGLKVSQKQGVGHEVTAEMVEDAGEWIYNWAVAPQPRQI
ncbi:hypothetical protein BCV70DRAFT_168376 [Testicularia cyperi]|uniref:Alpha/beta-hydrolase n=1 Tax=Testicularia cyperi TaxID=1882483 RepID=A0A317XW29_9BASI|nr:hypothetical protein BCV70DRAFT_168376 [Testicularia cyperi]